MRKPLLASVALLTAGAAPVLPPQPASPRIHPIAPPLGQTRVYLSTDREHRAVFHSYGGEFGNFPLISPISDGFGPAEYFEPAPGTKCLSLGPDHSSIEYAIKRPIRLGEKYRCRRSSFRVLRCFDQCRAAIVEVKHGLSGGAPGFSRSYLYVDSCRGILAFSWRKLTRGMPLDAEWLRGDIGILDGNGTPGCDL